ALNWLLPPRTALGQIACRLPTKTRCEKTDRDLGNQPPSQPAPRADAAGNSCFAEPAAFFFALAPPTQLLLRYGPPVLAKSPPSMHQQVHSPPSPASLPIFS